jgi:hypothetical protein
MPARPHAEPHPQQSPLAATPLSLFFRLADIWRLTTDQQVTLLGSPARSTFFKWKKEGGAVSSDTTERISHLGAIFKDLAILLETPEAGDRWLKAPNRYFDGHSALDVMLEGRLADIIRVRQYLDAQRGG